MAVRTDIFCVEDLKKERTKCSFNQEELTNLLDGGKEMTALRRKMCESFFNDPVFTDGTPVDYLSHEERYGNELRKACHALQKLNAENYTISQYHELGPAELARDGNPLSVHMTAFIGALMGLCNEEQKTLWLGKAMKGEIIGTYAQTELGHGTNVRGLETTATYDEKTQEFVLHSPTLTATKWWPGSLGKTANHAVVMAQLYIKGKCYGPHPFFAQIRCEETHRSMPGVTLGEIGPKLGVKSNDNGFMRFNHYRIPKNNLLMKHSQVLQDGTYNPPLHGKLAYISMVNVRVSLVAGCCALLKKAVTIATRYSAVRHQSELIPGAPEPQILDYLTQQYKLIPHIASVFALHFASHSLSNLYAIALARLDEGEVDMLPELHAMSCGVKVIGGIDATEGIEICRLACGGHGYLCSAGFTRFYGAATSIITAEGESTVLWLQVARYLVKSYRAASNGDNLVGSVTYLSSVRQNDGRTLNLTSNGLVDAFKISAAAKIAAAYAKLMTLVKYGDSYHQAWNKCSISLVQCAQSHIRYCICEEFLRAVDSLEASEGLKKLLQYLCRLYLIYHITLKEGDFLKSGALSTRDVEILEDEMGELLAALRAQAVSIVDSFDIHDKILDSTLGCWDGNVYERLYEEAQKSPLNKTDVPMAYYKYLRPLMKAHPQSNL